MSKICANIKSEKGFYVGDICHVLSDELYQEVWCKQNDCREGIITDPTTNLQFAVAATVGGDGCFYGSYGELYIVDSGTIGIVPLELVEIEDGNIFRTVGTATFEADNGNFVITIPGENTIKICTTPNDEFDFDLN